MSLVHATDRMHVRAKDIASIMLLDSATPLNTQARHVCCHPHIDGLAPGQVVVSLGRTRFAHCALHGPHGHLQAALGAPDLPRRHGPQKGQVRAGGHARHGPWSLLIRAHQLLPGEQRQTAGPVDQHHRRSRGLWRRGVKSRERLLDPGDRPGPDIGPEQARAADVQRRVARRRAGPRAEQGAQLAGQGRGDGAALILEHAGAAPLGALPARPVCAAAAGGGHRHPRGLQQLQQGLR